MKYILPACFYIVAVASLDGQQSISALFLGNSYTYYHNLPQLVADIALSQGDTLFFDAHAPGGYTLQQHSTDVTALNKIASRDWDYVILQEQSQLPSFSPQQVQAQVIPFADTLNRKIGENDSCTQTLFYMTWGRQNGDAQNCPIYPPVCTYDGMQQRLRDSYVLMAQQLDAEVSPVGVAWKYVRDHYPGINLYENDGSHPNLSGSYLAACTFYAAMFHQSPAGGFIPNGLTAGRADTLQQAAALIVFDSLAVWRIDTTHVQADFTSTTQFEQSYVDFNNTSQNADAYYWDFGDGTFSTDTHPGHQYNPGGVYLVTLIAYKGCETDTITRVIISQVMTGLSANDPGSWRVFPNPVTDFIRVESPEATLLRLYTAAGKYVCTFPVQPGGQVISLEQLPAGLYYISDGKNTARKIVKTASKEY